MSRATAQLGGLTLLLLGGCQGNIGAQFDDPGAPGPPDVVPKNVPAQPDRVESSTFCKPLSAGEKLASVSPEGHAWLLAAGEPGETQVRVLDAFDAAAELLQTVAFGEVHELLAWSGDDAAVLADGGLWRLEDLARIQLTPPPGFVVPAALCGNPASNGALLSTGQLFERRDDAQWWGFDPKASSDVAPRTLVRFDGDCHGTDDVQWMTSADGTLWRVEPVLVDQPVRFVNLRAVAATSIANEAGTKPSTVLAMLETDRLWIGPAWQSWLFPGETPRQLSAAAGKLWMESGEQLLRFDGVSWVDVRHDVKGSVQSINAHSGGVWLETASEICHVGAGTMLRVSGIRPHVRSKEFDYPFDVFVSEPTAEVIASIDGEPITLTPSADLASVGGRARLDDVGWHELRLEAGETTRSIVVKRLPEVERSWASDVKPIYEANCTGGECHRAGAPADGPPDLSSYEAWGSLADAIRLRVVDARTMPPIASQGPDWGQDQVDIIAQWIEGGRSP